MTNIIPFPTRGCSVVTDKLAAASREARPNLKQRKEIARIRKELHAIHTQTTESDHDQSETQ